MAVHFRGSGGSARGGGHVRFGLIEHLFRCFCLADGLLVEHALQLRVRLLPFRRTQLRQEHRVQASYAEHNLLIRAMTRGDSAEAAVIMREHMLNASDALMRFLARTEPSASD